MKQFRFILLCATIAVISSSLTGCKKGVYDEQAALAAQKDLLQFKYDQEIKLENLRSSNQIGFYTSYYALQYNFSVRTYLFNDSLSRTTTAYNNDQYRKRDIAVQVIDLVTDAPVIGAEVTIPTLVGTVIKVKTDSTGVARFSPNVNIPNPASAIVTMDGYASGSTFATIGGSTNTGASATISIWNLKNATNTVKGKVYIENDLTNDAAEVAKKAFVNAFTFVNVNGYQQRFDFIATTDDNGDYSMKIPNLINALQMSYTALEGTSKMYVNGYVPGMDTVPTLKTIDATFFLGESTFLTTAKSTNNGIGGAPTNTYSTGYVQQPDGTIYSIPTTLNRYHVAAAADSNARSHYVKNLSFSANTLSSATADSAILNGSTIYTNSSLLSAANYSSNTTTPTTQYPSKYLAGTTVRDTVNATLYDLAANADGHWIAAPTLKFVLVTDSTTTVGKKFKYIEKLIQVKGGGTTKKADVNFFHQQYVYNLVKTYNNITASMYNARDINGSFANITTEKINNGKTYVYNMSYGAGKLKTAVR
jgi:hypothetical protein